jgi:hypothetical protein
MSMDQSLVEPLLMGLFIKFLEELEIPLSWVLVLIVKLELVELHRLAMEIK